MDCLFCKIIGGEIPSDKVYEDDYIFAFKDINPAAKVHILVVPKIHIKDADALDQSNIAMVEKVYLAVPNIAKEAGITGGYRVITNIGAHGQQSVPHIHFHIIGGQQLRWELV